MQNDNKNNGNSGLYSIFDVKTASYTPPMAFANSEVAKRSVIMMMLENPGAPFALFSADYTLMKIADWNPSEGVVPLSAKESIGTLLELMAAHTAIYRDSIKADKEDKEVENG